MTASPQQTAAVATAQESRRAEIDKTIAFGNHGFEITTMEQAGRVAEVANRSGLFKGFKSPAEFVIAIQIGAEMGFSAMQSLQVIHMIDGKPSIAVEAMAAKVESDGALEPGTKIMFKYDGKGDDRSCTVWSTPKGGERITSEPVRLGDFKHLRDRPNWKNYPDRMLKARAVGFHVRDYYAASVRNLPSSDEVRDYESTRGAQPERDVTPPKTPDPLLKPREMEPVDAAAQPVLFGCAHPHGFAASGDSAERFCIDCGQSEDSE